MYPSQRPMIVFRPEATSDSRPKQPKAVFADFRNRPNAAVANYTRRPISYEPDDHVLPTFRKQAR